MRRSVLSWAKGGRRCLQQRRDHRGRGGLRHASPLGQGREGTGRGIAEGAERCQQYGQEDVNPLIGFALAHAEQAPVHHLEQRS